MLGRALDALDLAHASPLGWIRLATRGRYDAPRHIDLLCRELLDVALGKTKRLVVEMPVRSGKSETTSVYFPSWFIARWPRKEVILATYEADKAHEWGGKARDAFSELAPSVFGSQLGEDTTAKKHWKTSLGGGMLSTGIGGPATGSGADVFIIDDPVKNPKIAWSPTYQRDHVDWYKGVARTRLHPEGGVVINMARWDTKDLAGQLMSEWDAAGLPYRRIRLTALAEENDPLGRAVGDPLWPERYGRKLLEETRLEVGPTLWAALYQQNPLPPGGRIFKKSWIRHYRKEGDTLVLLPPDGPERRYPLSECEVFQTKDSAETTGERSAYSCIAVWLVTPTNDLILWSVTREREELAELRSMCRSSLHQYGGVLHIEKKSHGTALIQDLQREGLPVVAFEPKGNKIVRARVAEARFSAGRVYLPQSASWLETYLDELLHFPASEYADQVDVTSHACIVLAERKEPRIRILGED